MKHLGQKSDGKDIVTQDQLPFETTTTIGALINSATEKTTPVDADMVGLMDSAAANILKKLSWANIKATLIGTLHTWTARQVGAVTALTSTSGSIAINLGVTNNYSHTMTEDTTLAAPTNAVAGTTGHIVFTQDATTARTLAFNAVWKPATGQNAVISTTLGSSNVMTYIVESSTVVTYGWANKGIS